MIYVRSEGAVEVVLYFSFVQDWPLLFIFDGLVSSLGRNSSLPPSGETVPSYYSLASYVCNGTYLRLNETNLLSGGDGSMESHVHGLQHQHPRHTEPGMDILGIDGQLFTKNIYASHAVQLCNPDSSGQKHLRTSR